MSYSLLDVAGFLIASVAFLIVFYGMVGSGQPFVQEQGILCELYECVDPDTFEEEVLEVLRSGEQPMAASKIAAFMDVEPKPRYVHVSNEDSRSESYTCWTEKGTAYCEVTEE